MVRASIDDVERDPVGFLRRVEAGESVLVTRGDRAVAEIKPVTETDAVEAGLRPHGLAKGDFSVPRDFDAPLPADVLDGFEGR